MTGPKSGAPCYPVEISGWDKDENFFVERTNLEWLEEDAKQVALRNPVRKGSLVFVRLIELADMNAAIPVAYRAHNVQALDQRGQFQVLLSRMWPRDRCP